MDPFPAYLEMPTHVIGEPHASVIAQARAVCALLGPERLMWPWTNHSNTRTAVHRLVASLECYDARVHRFGDAPPTPEHFRFYARWLRVNLMCPEIGGGPGGDWSAAFHNRPKPRPGAYVDETVQMPAIGSAKARYDTFRCAAVALVARIDDLYASYGADEAEYVRRTLQ